MRKPDIDPRMFIEWQDITDLVAKLCNVPSALLMRINIDTMEVISSSDHPGSPYQVSETAPLEGKLYCETVIKTQRHLHVPNALKDPVWDHNPDIDLGMIPYYGVPVNWPDGSPFGTFCILDKQEKSATDDEKEIIARFARIIEITLKLMVSEHEKRLTLETLEKAEQIVHLGSWDWDITNNQLFWTDEIYRIFGVQPRAFKETYEAFLSFVHSDDKTMVQKSVNSALAGSPYDIEHRIIRNDGEEWVVREIGEVKFDSFGTPVRMMGTVHDITKQKREKEELALRTKMLMENETKFKAMFHTSPDPMWIIDENGYFILCNDSAAKTLKLDSIQELASTHPSELSPELQPDGQRSLNKAIEMMAIAKSKGSHHFEWEYCRSNGECFSVDVTLSKITIKDTDHLFCVWHDISDHKKNEQALQELNKKLEALSLQDGLTGIANRRMFDTRINLEWNRCIRGQHPLSLIMIDIDYFKLYNDHNGHQSGDECLIKVAQKLAELSKRAVDLCARYGGEEFALLLPNTGMAPAAQLAEKCREEIYQLSIPHELSNICDVVTISVGVSSITPNKGTFSSSLIEHADNALYLAKEDGRNRVKVFLLKSQPEV